MKKILLFLIMTALSLTASSIEEKADYLENVKDLVILTQKMRGDTNVYIKGGDIYFSEIDEDREKITHSLRDLRRKFETVDIKTNEGFDKLNIYMQNLNEVASELDSMVTFRAYTLLIDEMIKLGIAVQSNFYLDSCERRKRMSAVMMQNILPMTEHIGKLRGLVAGMAVNGSFNSDEVDFSKEYLTDVSDELEKMIAAMKDLNKRYPNSYPRNLDKQLYRYEVDVKEFITLIDKKFSEAEAKKVGNVEEISLDSYDFYTYGTDLIEYTLSFFEMNEIILRAK